MTDSLSSFAGLTSFDYRPLVDAIIAAVGAAGPVHGQALVVTNGEPRPVAEILRRVCAASGVPGPRGRVPLPVARAAGTVVEAGWRLARRPGVPPLTRFLAEQLGTAHWFDQQRTTSLLRGALGQGLASVKAAVLRA